MCVLAAIAGLAAGPAVGAQIDPAISAVVAKVSAERLRATVEHLTAFGTRNTFSEAAPAGRGVFAARDWLVGRFKEIAAGSGGRMSVALDEYVQKADGRRMTRDVRISSVVATLRGDEPGGRTYVISSHFDSRNTDVSNGTRDAPGADDNASGTAAVLEAARVLAPMTLRATVIFAAYDAEEQGLFGSAHHAQALRDAGVEVEGDLNNDIIGASIGDRGQRNANRIRIFSEALAAGSDPANINLLGSENDSPSRELARFVAAAGDAYVTGFHGEMVNRADRFLRGGDHLSFNKQGFAAVRLTEPVENFAHQHQDVRTEGGVPYGDLIQFMDFDYLARATRYNVAVLASLALGPGRPAQAFISTAKLTNDTTLTWRDVAGAKRYEVVRRLTTEPDWTHAEDAGASTTATMPFSKDEWVFGVRAIDAAGHAGVVTFPVPDAK
jgi:hypothetical protein